MLDEADFARFGLHVKELLALSQSSAEVVAVGGYRPAW